MAARLYVDVNVPLSITEGLRRRAVDVVMSQEDGTREFADEAVLQRASALGRVLFTQDEDFFAITAEWQSAGREFAGLIYAHQMGPGIGQIIEDLELLMQCTEPEELRNQVIYLPLK